MKISFLVTFYNQEEYVKDSLDSILAIDIPCDWEILIGDDGSSDCTVEIVDEYIKKYPENIKLYIMPRDINVIYDSVNRASLNRLNLLGKSTGDYFCIIDGDDYYIDKSFVRESLDVFKSDDRISIVSYDFCYLTNQKFKKRNNIFKSYNRKVIDKHTYLKNLYYHSGSCVYKMVWGKDRNDFLNELGYYDDNDIVINSLNYGEMFHINKPIYAYRQTGTSVYTSLNDTKKALLNVAGFDTDRKLIDSCFLDDLIIRYSYSILWLYCLKFEDCGLFDQYLLRYNSILKQKSSLLYGLIFYDSLADSERKSVDEVIGFIRKNKLITYLKVILKKYYMRYFL